MTYLGSFGREFRKTIIIFEISTLEFVKNESLTHTVNFTIGSAFSKGLGLCPDPLYKVCFSSSYNLLTSLQIIAESSIKLAKYSPFSQLHLLGFQT